MNQKLKLWKLRSIDPSIPDIYKLGLKLNGCTLSPDIFIFMNITCFCDYHDYLYSLGGTEEDRLKADKILRDFIIKYYSKRCRCIRYESIKIARTYYFFVRKYGSRFFNYHEN